MLNKFIIGAVAGDIIGSRHKGKLSDPYGFTLFNDNSSDFTSDSVLTIAVMDSFLNGRDYSQSLKIYGRKYPGKKYGTTFSRWLRQDNAKPYFSWNNGAALRVSPVGFAARTISEAFDESFKCAEVSHNHPDGIKGAQAIALTVFLAKNGRTKEEIRNFIERTFGYNLQRKIEEIRPDYYYDQSAEGSVPEAVIAFLESSDYESAVRLAVSLGGNSSSLACITGGIAQAFYKDIPVYITKPVIEKLSPELFDIINEFSERYPLSLFH